MKKIIFLFSLLQFCINVHAQTKLVLYRNDGQRDSVYCHVGDYVRINLTTGKSIHGTISKIANGFFVVGRDTIRPEQVKVFSYKFKYPNTRGNKLISIGAVMIGGGTIMILSAFKTDNDIGKGLFLFTGGIVLGAGGLGAIVAGAIVNQGIDSGSRTLGTHWGLKIE